MVGQLIKFRISLACFLLVWASNQVGCGDSENRLSTFKVSGKVTVNGKAAKGVVLQLVPIDTDPLEKTTLRPGSVTESDGSFEMTTYSVGDGAPNGSYRMVFFWPPADTGAPPSMEQSKVKKSHTGPPDRMNGQFFDPEKSKFPVAVVSEAVDLEVINLNWKK